MEPQNVRRTGASAWLNMAAKLAAELEDLEPAPCRRQASLVAMSECGDLLVVTSGNTLRYGHCSCGDLRIVPVSIPIGELDGTTLHSVRFNSSADAILLTGPHFLCLVLPPTRGQGGALSTLDQWNVSVLIDNDVSAMLVDAIFPPQFDDHICTLDTDGLLRFWNVIDGAVTTFETGLNDARAFCFGIEQWGRFSAFIVTSNQLAMLSPVLPRQCRALRCEIQKLRNACEDDLRDTRDVLAIEQATATIKWLESTFPTAVIKSNEGQINSGNISWIKADKHRHPDRPTCRKFASLELRGSAPVQLCALDHGALIILPVATDDGHIDVVILCHDASTPLWRVKSGQSTSDFIHLESLFVTNLAHGNSVRLEIIDKDNLLFIHDHGIAIINFFWMDFLGDGLLDLESLVSTRPSTCQHIVSCSDTLRTVVGAGFLYDFAVGSDTILCWFDDGSCCIVDKSMSRYVSTELNICSPCHIIMICEYFN